MTSSHVVQQSSSRLLNFGGLGIGLIFGLPLVHALPLHLLLDDLGVESVRVGDLFLQGNKILWFSKSLEHCN